MTAPSAIHLLWIAGAIHAGIVLANIPLPHRLRVRENLENVPVFVRQIFYVHWFYIVLIVSLFSALCFGIRPRSGRRQSARPLPERVPVRFLASADFPADFLLRPRNSACQPRTGRFVSRVPDCFGRHFRICVASSCDVRRLPCPAEYLCLRRNKPSGTQFLVSAARPCGRRSQCSPGFGRARFGIIELLFLVGAAGDRAAWTGIDSTPQRRPWEHFDAIRILQVPATLAVVVAFWLPPGRDRRNPERPVAVAVRFDGRSAIYGMVARRTDSRVHAPEHRLRRLGPRSRVAGPLPGRIPAHGISGTHHSLDRGAFPLQRVCHRIDRDCHIAGVRIARDCACRVCRI